MNEARAGAVENLRAAGRTFLRRQLPGNVRIDVQAYMGSPSRAYKSVPGFAIIRHGVTVAEAERLWRLVEAVVIGEEWRERTTATPDRREAAG